MRGDTNSNQPLPLVRTFKALDFGGLMSQRFLDLWGETAALLGFRLREPQRVLRSKHQPRSLKGDTAGIYWHNFFWGYTGWIFLARG